MDTAVLSISRPELLIIFKELQRKFNFSQEQDEVFKSKCLQFQQNMSGYLKASEKNVAESNPLFQQVVKFRKTKSAFLSLASNYHVKSGVFAQ